MNIEQPTCGLRYSGAALPVTVPPTGYNGSATMATSLKRTMPSLARTSGSTATNYDQDEYDEGKDAEDGKPITIALCVLMIHTSMLLTMSWIWQVTIPPIPSNPLLCPLLLCLVGVLVLPSTSWTSSCFSRFTSAPGGPPAS
jgi:hypothetical protein